MVVSARVGTIADLTALQRPPRRADDRKVLVENFPVALGVCLVGNVLVHYGGDDPGVLARVKAAVVALRR